MTDETRRVLIRNPHSGDRKRSVQAREIAMKRGYEIRESAARGETLRLAREVAEEGVDLVAACGGDGTLNEVVRGVDEGGALDDVRLGVIPAGTGNNFAGNVGVTGIRQAFDVLDRGEERRIDLGMANGRPFVNSCVGGLTAEASGSTSPELKRRLGTLAYVLNTLQRSRSYDGLTLDIRAGPDRTDPVWAGQALMVLIGNGRRFPGEEQRQANMEDGLLNVVIIKRAPTINYLTRGAADRLLRRGASHLVRVKVPHLELRHDGEPVRFSFDGEMIESDALSADCRPGAMRFHVGGRYEPDPMV